MSLIIELIVLGVIFYFIEQIPMDPIFNTAVRIIAILIALFLVLGAFGVVTPIAFPIR